jgi:aminopeptidase N
LFDEGVSTAKNKQRVGTVVTHELAHQWFGDLVSPKWWDDIWLNEGWATYYEYHALATVETDWQIDQQFIQEEMHASLRADGLENAHPLIDNVENPNSYNPVFDGLAYTKGIAKMFFLIKKYTNKYKVTSEHKPRVSAKITKFFIINVTIGI